jgi:hypothetical protein
MFVDLTKLETFMYFRLHQLRIVLLVDSTKRKKHMFVNLTKLQTYMYFSPQQLQIVLLVDPTKRKTSVLY